MLTLRSQLEPRRSLLALIAGSLLGLVGVGLVGAVAALRPREPAAPALVVAAGCGLLSTLLPFWQASVPTLWGHLWPNFLYDVALVALAGAMLHFFLLFPAPHPLVGWLDQRAPHPMRRLGAIPLLYAALAVPLGLHWAAHAAVPALVPASFTAMLLAPMTGALAVAVRSYRRPQTRYTRPQLKWIAAAIVINAGRLVWDFVVSLRGFSAAGLMTPQWVGLLLELLVPVAIGIAVLRYRLFDIDILIHRALVYVPLTALLGGLYAASTTVAPAVLGAHSNAAVAVTTLLVVAAFDPLRARLQAAVDRWFHDSESEAARLDAFERLVGDVVPLLRAASLVQRLLDEAVGAFGAAGGTVTFHRITPFLSGRCAPGDAAPESSATLVWATPGWEGVARICVDLTVPPASGAAPGCTLGSIALGPRRSGAEYSAADCARLQRAADRVAWALALQRQWPEPYA